MGEPSSCDRCRGAPAKAVVVFRVLGPGADHGLHRLATCEACADYVERWALSGFGPANIYRALD